MCTHLLIESQHPRPVTDSKNLSLLVSLITIPRRVESGYKKDDEKIEAELKNSVEWWYLIVQVSSDHPWAWSLHITIRCHSSGQQVPLYLGYGTTGRNKAPSHWDWWTGCIYSYEAPGEGQVLNLLWTTWSRGKTLLWGSRLSWILSSGSSEGLGVLLGAMSNHRVSGSPSPSGALCTGWVVHLPLWYPMMVDICIGWVVHLLLWHMSRMSGSPSPVDTSYPCSPRLTGSTSHPANE